MTTETKEWKFTKKCGEVVPCKEILIGFNPLKVKPYINKERHNAFSGIATDDGAYFTNNGDFVKKGDILNIYMPNCLHKKPYRLIEAKNIFSSVNYQSNAEITLESADGIRFNIDRPDWYGRTCQNESEA